MAKVLFQVSYDIKPEKRADYLALIGELRKLYTESLKKDYTVCEQQGRKNSFVEQFVCQSAEEYENLEDGFDETIEGLNARVQELTVGGKAKYLTLLEV